MKNAMVTLYGLIVVLCPVVSFATHPSANLIPRDPEKSIIFAGSSPELAGVGEIRFDFDFPTASELSSNERYVLAGAMNANNTSGLEPWWQAVMFVAMAYEGNTGQWPLAITDELVENISGGDDRAESRWRQELKSPITGQYPRLDASNFSAGDLYMRRMTRQEVSTLVSQGAYLLSEDYEDQVEQNGGESVGLPIYVRIYGETRVLCARFLQFGVKQ
jgi:hypothetical protein